MAGKADERRCVSGEFGADPMRHSVADPVRGAGSSSINDAFRARTPTVPRIVAAVRIGMNMAAAHIIANRHWYR